MAGLEVMQLHDAADYTGQGGWDLRISHIGDVLLARHIHTADLCIEGVRDLAGSATENDCSVAGGQLVNGETVSLQPRGDFGDIGLRDSELRAEILRGQILAIERRLGVFLRGEQLSELSILRGIAF